MSPSTKAFLTIGFVVGCAAVALAQQRPVPRQKQAALPESIKSAIADYGKVYALPDAAQQPRARSRIVVDLTGGGDPPTLNPAIEKVARYVNIYRGAGKAPVDVHIAVILHGDATLCALNSDAYAGEFHTEGNPHLDCLRILHEAGVDLYVCGQSLIGKGRRPDEVADVVQVAASALTALVNFQTDGYAYIPLQQ